jgi:hypothetical protein
MLPRPFAFTSLWSTAPKAHAESTSREGKDLRRIEILLLITIVGVLAVGGSSALADQPGYTCSGGQIPGGTYGNVTVTGVCQFNGNITINGALTVADGAILNNHASGLPHLTADVVINGNISVGKGAVLGLGGYGNGPVRSNTVVNGNINANQPLDLYLSGITVHGNVISNGGGPGTSQFLNFPTKDDTIDGNLIVQGWTGGWAGIIRDHVGGNVIFSKNTSVLHQIPDGCGTDPGESPCTGIAPGADSDSSEVDTNTIGGNLICQGNSPAAQLGDAIFVPGATPNTVAGNKIGECAGL